MIAFKPKVRTKKYFKKIDIFISISIFIIFITIILLKIFTAKSEKYLSTYALNQTKNIAESLIIEAIYKQKDIEYSDIIITNKNENDEIIDIDFNSGIMNNYLYIITNEILKNLKNLETGKFENINLNYYKTKDNIYYLPSGLIYNIPFLTNISPKIPFKITPVGNIQNEIKTKITDYGINNSLLELYIKINVQMKILYPFISETVQVEKEIPIMTKLIQGKIPSYYGGLISSTTPTN